MGGVIGEYRCELLQVGNGGKRNRRYTATGAVVVFSRANNPWNHTAQLKQAAKFRCYFLRPKLYCWPFCCQKSRASGKFTHFGACEFELGKMQLPTQRRGERCGGDFLGPSLRTVHFLVEMPQLTPRTATGLHRYSGGDYPYRDETSP